MTIRAMATPTIMGSSVRLPAEWANEEVLVTLASEAETFYCPCYCYSYPDDALAIPAPEGAATD